MKTLKTIYPPILVTILVSVLAFYSSPHIENYDASIQDTVLRYSDGIFEGQSRHNYKDEPYWGKVQIKIEDGIFTSVRFIIRDSNLHETFDQYYEKHFEKIPEYIQQCRNDWKGIQSYPVKLLENQDINKVDAMSGATWSYNIFKASVDSSLKKAVKR